MLLAHWVEGCRLGQVGESQNCLLAENWTALAIRLRPCLQVRLLTRAHLLGAACSFTGP